MSVFKNLQKSVVNPSTSSDNVIGWNQQREELQGEHSKSDS